MKTFLLTFLTAVTFLAPTYVAGADEDPMCRKVRDMVNQVAGQNASEKTGKELLELYRQQLAREREGSSSKDEDSRGFESMPKLSTVSADASDLYLELFGVSRNSPTYNGEPQTPLKKSKTESTEQCDETQLPSLPKLALNSCVIRQLTKFRNSRDDEEAGQKLLSLTRFLVETLEKNAGQPRAPEATQIDRAFPLASLALTALGSSPETDELQARLETATRKHFGVSKKLETLLPLLTFCQGPNAKAPWQSALLGQDKPQLLAAAATEAARAGANAASATTPHAATSTREEKEPKSSTKDEYVHSEIPLSTKDTSPSYSVSRPLDNPLGPPTIPLTRYQKTSAPPIPPPPTSNLAPQERLARNTGDEETKEEKSDVKKIDRDSDAPATTKKSVAAPTLANWGQSLPPVSAVIAPAPPTPIISVDEKTPAPPSPIAPFIVQSTFAYPTAPVESTIERRLAAIEKFSEGNEVTEEKAPARFSKATEKLSETKKSEGAIKKEAKAPTVENERDVATFNRSIQRAIELVATGASDKQTESAHQMIDALVQRKSFEYLVKWGLSTEGKSGEAALKAMLSYVMKKTGKKGLPCLYKKPNTDTSLECFINLNPSRSIQKQIREIFSRRSLKNVTFRDPVERS